MEYGQSCLAQKHESKSIKMKIAKHWSIQCLVTDLHVWAFDLVFEMDGAHYPSYCVDANSLWIEEPCEQQQVHEIASILQKNEVWNKIFNDFLPAYKCHMQFKELACVSKWNRVKNQHGVLFFPYFSPSVKWEGLKNLWWK